LYTLLNVFAHLIAVTTVAIIKANASTFGYDLRFYTLIQFGVLLAILNSYLLGEITRICQGNWKNYSGIYKAGALQILITLPLVPFNPISFLPTLTAISLMLLVYRASRQQTLQTPLKTEIQNTELVLTSV
ncbi:MAG: hypothetical protein M3Q05_12205, partial [Bacteroidota bacterium]|nr:hypothetical protein [Bacteroidota bacterium]